MKYLERNSSTRRREILILMTATHSAKERGVTWQMRERKGMYRVTKWRVKDSMMAPSSSRSSREASSAGTGVEWG